MRDVVRGGHGAGDGDAVEQRLRRLDDDALGAFVADLWAARGFEVGREDGVLVATGGVERVAVVAVGRTLFGSPSLPDRSVDVVVAPAAGSRARTFAEGTGARLLDAGDLHGMLRHAVDAADADRLAADHLGAPLSDLRPPPSVRARHRLGAAGSVVAAEPMVAASLVVLLVVAAASVTAFGTPDRPAAELLGRDRPAAASVGAGPADQPGSAGDGLDSGDGLDAGNDRDGTAGGDTGTVDPAVAEVPGLSRDGIENLSALAAAHEARLANRSYTVWLDWYGPRDREPGAEEVQRDIDVSVAGERVRIRTEVEDEYGRDPVASVYHDGGSWYAKNVTGANATYHRAKEASLLPVTAVDPAEFGGTVQRFLATPNTDVTGPVERDGERYYRVEGTGTPARLARLGVEAYTVVAYVSPEGLVASARANYTVNSVDGTFDVTAEWTYGRFGTTTVTEPAWFGERFGNATASATSTRPPSPSGAS